MKRTLAISTLLVALLAAGTALAAVGVYSTSFSKRSDVRALNKLSGDRKACERDWRKKSTLGVTVKGGKEDCALSTPVEGDSNQPDHIVTVVAKMTRATDRKTRDEAYVGAAVRANRKENYELRVFPKPRRFQLLKSGQVIEQGRDNKVAGLAKKNKLEIRAIGDSVAVKVNGKKLANFRDENAEQVTGRKTAVTFGSRKKSKKAKVKAFFDQLKVQVPNP